MEPIRPWRDPAPNERPRPDDAAVRATKALRARALTDPLGAKGHRRTRRRVVTESQVRRSVFAASVATFAACFGVVLETTQGHATPATAPPTATVAAVVNVPAVPANGNLVKAAAQTFLASVPTPVATSAANGDVAAAPTFEPTTAAPTATAEATTAADATATDVATTAADVTASTDVFALSGGDTTTLDQSQREAPASHVQTHSS